MARRSAVAVAVSPRPAAKAFRNTVRVLGALTVLSGALWLYWTTEEFLLNDDRFLLAGPPEPGVPSEHFQIDGIVNASEHQITQIFARDFGRSIYLTPIEERRRKLLAVDWVKNASINRFWPNRLLIRITERKPVAFIQVPDVDNLTMYTLVDADGVILDPQRATSLHLPVLSGVSKKEPEIERATRVKRFLRLQSELGDHMNRISEIDVSDISNLKVTQKFGDRAITLMLGDQKFKERLEEFLGNSQQILEQLPNVTRIDLRISRRYTAAGGD